MGHLGSSVLFWRFCRGRTAEICPIHIRAKLLTPHLSVSRSLNERAVLGGDAAGLDPVRNMALRFAARARHGALAADELDRLSQGFSLKSGVHTSQFVLDYKLICNTTNKSLCRIG